jgi:hypothetical protein
LLLAEIEPAKMSSNNGTVFWVFLIVSCFQCFTFCSAFFIEVTGESSFAITDDFLEENFKTQFFALGNNTFYGIYYHDGNDYAMIINNDATENMDKIMIFT